MVAIHRTPSAPALHLDYLTDALAGLNVRQWNYLDVAAHEAALAEAAAKREAEMRLYYPWDYAPARECFVLYVWDDGLDYDLDGTPYQDDAPGYHAHSYHATERGAQIDAAHLEDAGINPNRIYIAYGETERWDYDKSILP